MRKSVESISASSQGLAIPSKSLLPPRPPSASHPFVGSAPAHSAAHVPLSQSALTSTLQSTPYYAPPVSFPRAMSVPFHHPSSSSASTVQQPSGFPYMQPQHINVKLSQGQASQLALLQRMSPAMLLASQSNGGSPSSHSSALTSMPLFGSSPGSASPTAFAGLSLGSSPRMGPSPHAFQSSGLSCASNGPSAFSQLPSSLPPAPGLLSSSFGSSLQSMGAAPAGAGSLPMPTQSTVGQQLGLSTGSANHHAPFQADMGPPEAAATAAATGQHHVAAGSLSSPSAVAGSAPALLIAPLDTGLQPMPNGSSPPNGVAPSALGASHAAHENGLHPGLNPPGATGRPSPLGQPNGSGVVKADEHVAPMEVAAAQQASKPAGRGANQRSTLSTQLRKGPIGIAKSRGVATVRLSACRPYLDLHYFCV